MSNKPIYVTLGGDRLGSGNKMVQKMHNFERSSHDISTVWASSMAPGVVTPCFCDICTIGTTYEMKIRELVKTIPTKGPLFGSFEFRVEVFVYPLRLTQGILHNNPIKLGLNAKNVLMPKANIVATKYTNWQAYKKNGGNIPVKFATSGVSSLVNYIGAQSLPLDYTNTASGNRTIPIDAGPMLAYYDYCKNYKFNKQEDNAYVIGTTSYAVQAAEFFIGSWKEKNTNPYWKAPFMFQGSSAAKEGTRLGLVSSLLVDEAQNITTKVLLKNPLNNQTTEVLMSQFASWQQTTEWDNSIPGEASIPSIPSSIKLSLTEWVVKPASEWTDIPNGFAPGGTVIIAGVAAQDATVYQKYFAKGYELTLNSFPIQNIDDARYLILSNNKLGQRVTIETRETTNGPSTINYLPYAINCEQNEGTGISRNCDSMNGLVTACYKADLFNCWLNSEWIDGPNGINELSAVPVNNGVMKIDDFLVQKQVYNMWNRTAVADGTYYGYQEAMWGESIWRSVESPVYCGGMSSEIVFEEVVSTAETQTNTENPLGSLGGRGTTRGKDGRKGGTIKIRIDEASYVMAVATITPRITYEAACKFFLTDINSFADLHNPNLDRIGFQNLPVRQAAGWNGTIGNTDSIGKQPSWIQYQTNYNTVHGDFAIDEKCGFMVLKRDYEPEQNNENEPFTVGDLTTYIDPTKFNNAFAEKALEAQNFWVQIAFDCIVRRKMSANEIPNA